MVEHAAVSAFRSLSCLLASWLLATTAAAAETGPEAKPEDLPGEGMPHLIDLALLGQYQRVAMPRKANDLRSIGTFDLRSRGYLGRTISHCFGLDGQIGGSDEGFTYGAVLYPIGLGYRWGNANVLSLCGGGGLDRVGTAVPLAARFPADLSVAFELGPVRPILWVRPSWLAAKRRRDGSAISFIDELEAGVLVRFAPQHRYWARLTAGGGFTIGVNYRELMDTRSVGGTVGFEFAGGK